MDKFHRHRRGDQRWPEGVWRCSGTLHAPHHRFGPDLRGVSGEFRDVVVLAERGVAHDTPAGDERRQDSAVEAGKAFIHQGLVDREVCGKRGDAVSELVRRQGDCARPVCTSMYPGNGAKFAVPERHACPGAAPGEVGERCHNQSRVCRFCPAPLRLANRFSDDRIERQVGGGGIDQRHVHEAHLRRAGIAEDILCQ